MTEISTSAFGIDDDAAQVGMNRTKRILTGLALGGVLLFLNHDATAAQAPVALGAAATFGVLAGPTVTSTGATTVNGDLGVSPGTTVTGAPTVTGTLHLGDAVAAQAQLDLTTAYNDAAGRTVGAVAVAGNLGGLTLTPGLYKSTSSLEISSGDLTLDAHGDVNAVFIFQMASTLVTTSGRQVILSGGAKAANIFWQVGSSATLGTTSAFKGNILALASITLTTGAIVEGRLLARTAAVTLDSNTVGLGIPADTTPPTVSSTDPANAAAGVAINKRIAATFSEAMDASTITTTTITLKQGATPVAGTVTYVGTTATFAPASALATNTTYTATITTGVKDLAGNSLASAFGWSFTTGAAPDTTAPTVTLTDPADAALAVALNKRIAVTFSEAMDPLTISTTTLTLKQGITTVAGTVSYAAVGTTATFTPASGLAPLTTFAATITTGAKDLAGNPLLRNFTWSFTTGAAADTTPPTVIATVPANVATGVAINQTINVTFSEAMDPATISTANFTVAGPGTTPVTGTVAYNAGSKIATFTPTSNLAANTVYRATMTTGAKDLAGNAVANNFAWNFTTAATTAGQTPVALGSATTFEVLAGSTVTSTGATTVHGDLGISPGTAVTGFPPGLVNGTIHAGDAAAAQAQLDLTTAYNDAAGRTVGAITVAGNLGGQTLAPGLYKSTSSLEISSGDLTLDAQGDANAVWIFQMASTLTTTSGRQVILSGGAQAANIFWQVGSSATLGTTSAFKGNILALASITVTTGATVEGRLLARTAAVTLESNTLTSPSTGPASVGPITLVSPSGSVSPGLTQRYTWKADAAATWYQLYVLHDGKVLCDKWFASSDSVAQSGSGNFAVDVSGHTSGSYRWYVRGWNPYGMGTWSEPLNFSLGIPGAVTLLTPADNASLSDRRPQFSWSQSTPAATWFRLYVTRNGSKHVEQWVEGVTNWTPPTDLPAGNYSWWVQTYNSGGSQTYNSGGLGPWSTKSTFTIPVAIPTTIVLVSPTGIVRPATTQLYTWKIDAAATWYELYVLQNGKVLCDKWFNADNSVAQGGSGNFAVDVGGHMGGNYQWYVRGWSPDGLGPWSSLGSYSMLTVPLPGPVTLLTPANNASVLVRQPEFTWTASSPEADWYLVYVERNGSKYSEQ